MTDTSTRILAATCPEIFTDHEGAIGFDRIEHAGRVVSVVSEAKYRALRAGEPRAMGANLAPVGLSDRPLREVPETKAAPAVPPVKRTPLALTKGA